MDFEVAKKIVDSLEEVNKKLFELIPYIIENCSEKETVHLKREIARASGVIDLNIYPDILKKYPELDPLKEVD
jgi:hypothetical protein